MKSKPLFFFEGRAPEPEEELLLQKYLSFFPGENQVARSHFLVANPNTESVVTELRDSYGNIQHSYKENAWRIPWLGLLVSLAAWIGDR